MVGTVTPVDRLTGPDLSGFVPEQLGRPTDIGMIVILDAACLLDGDGQVQVDAVRGQIAGRLHLVPRLRQVVHRPAWSLGRPYWADAGAFDLSAHVRVHPLPAGAGRAELLQACADLRRAPLDRSRPLWQLWRGRPPGPSPRCGTLLRAKPRGGAGRSCETPWPRPAGAPGHPEQSTLNGVSGMR
jgi:hypothetical protein